MSGGVPSDDELAAIAIALAATAHGGEAAAAPASRISAWVLATRRPDLEFDDLLALRNACSIRS